MYVLCSVMCCSSTSLSGEWSEEEEEKEEDDGRRSKVSGIFFRANAGGTPITATKPSPPQ